MEELRAGGVGLNLDSRAILEGVSLTVKSGEMVAVTGPSGSGKTSLLMLVAGLQSPDSGEVTWDGHPLAQVPDLRQRTGIILQNHGLVAILTAAENVSLPLQVRQVPPGEVQQRTEDALAAVGLGEVSGHLVQDLSGGQQQRVGVARALAGDPELLIADEPTSELAANDRAMVLGLLREHANKGRIVVLASHDPDAVEACDRTLRLVDGRPRPA
ncbi:MAG: heme ABC exporter ATP-binding protein CcmA [Candidatus Dormiibacterota bacterium]